MDTLERKELREQVENAKAIAWDTCHKIYVLMDEKQVEIMKGYGYEALIEAKHSTPRLMYSTVLNWYNNSCPLKLIDAVSTSNDGQNEFYRTVAQR